MNGNANVQLIHGMSWLVDQASAVEVPEVGGDEAAYQSLFMVPST